MSPFKTLAAASSLLMAAQGGCVPSPIMSGATPEGRKLFAALDSEIGKEIQVSGYLRYEFENHNLYPTKNWEEESSDSLCIPIGVRVSDPALEKQVRRLNGSIVVVRGTVTQLVPNEHVSTALCKDVGILLQSVAFRRY